MRLLVAPRSRRSQRDEDEVNVSERYQLLAAESISNLEFVTNKMIPIAGSSNVIGLKLLQFARYL